MINKKRAGAKRALLIIMAAGTMMTSTLTVRADQEAADSRQIAASESVISESDVSEAKTDSTLAEADTEIKNEEAETETETSKNEDTVLSAEEDITEAAVTDDGQSTGTEETSKGTPHQVIDDQGRKYMVYDDGSHYTGWYSFPGCGDIYFDPNNNGAAATGAVSVTDETGTHTYIFDSNGVARKTPGTPLIDGKKYWIKSDGTAASGWLYLGSWKMYFDSTTYAARTKSDGVTDIDGHKYLFNADGVMQNFAGTTIIDGAKYWFSEEGYLRNGWLKLGDWTLYFDKDTYKGAAGVTAIDGKTYLFDNNGILKTSGTPVVNGKKYYINANNELVSGWINYGSTKMYFDPATYQGAAGITKINGKTYLFDNNGLLKTSGTPVVNGKKYYINANNELVSGWVNYGNAKMYFDPATYQGAAGITKINGKTYMFDDNGILKTSGTPMVNGKKYYINAANELVSGWVNYGSAKMYFDPTTYQGATGVTAVNGKKLIFDSNGLLVSGSGTFLVNGKKYCIDGNGNAVTGWVTFGSWKMYFDPATGVGAVGKVNIDGKTYYFNADGINYVPSNNSNQSMYDLAQGFSSDTQYLILVNKSLHRVAIYQGSKNNWQEIKYWPCVVGKPSTPTPSGTFKLKGRCQWFGADHKCWWATKIEGDYFFHTQIYYWDDAPRRILDGTMDAAASLGCVRLEEPNAYFIYKEIPRGTTVHIFN